MNRLLGKTTENLIGPIGLFLLCAFFVERWFSRFYLSPDSGYYLTAALNFAKHGTFFIYNNWPSRTMLPGTELYADFPPGFPTYLSFFVFIFRDPTLAAAIGQSIVLVALFCAVYRVLAVFKVDPILRLAAIFFLGVFKPHRDTLQSLLTEPLYIFFCLACFMCAKEILEKGESRKRWSYAYFFLFCAAAMRWNGFACTALFLLPIFRSGSKTKILKNGFLVLGFAALPILLWFLRNKIQLGSVTTFYGRPVILWERLGVPFVASIRWWGMGYVLLALIILGIALLPILMRRQFPKNLAPFYWTLVIGCLAQFFVIYFLSLVTMGMTPVDDRYLMPTYFFFTIGLVYSLDILTKKFHLQKIAYLGALVLCLSFAPRAAKAIHARGFHFFRWSRPVEEKLWNEIRNRPYVLKASHFYTNENHWHQIYAQMPQRVMWNENPSLMLPLWSIPKDPFFIVTQGSNLQKLFLERFEKEIPGLKKESLEGFDIYYR